MDCSIHEVNSKAMVNYHVMLISFRIITACNRSAASSEHMRNEPPRGKTNNVVSEQVRHNRPVQAQ